MSNANLPERGGSPFGRKAVLGMVVIGFAAFFAMLYFLSVGDTGRKDSDGQAHAAANGLNGYSGLVQLLEAEGYEVSRSRLQSGLETGGLLVLTPPAYYDAEELTEILQKRAYIGPTLIIAPKWMTFGFPPDVPDEVTDKVRDGWIQLGSPWTPDWLEEVEAPFAVDAEIYGARNYEEFEALEDDPEALAAAEAELAEQLKRRDTSWQGLSMSGKLPDPRIAGIEQAGDKDVLVSDAAGRALAVSYWGADEFGYSDDTEQITVVVEPDLMNNYGVADADRAALAIALVQQAGYGQDYPVTFDLTLNGFGGSVNLLTLAFRPPFLAATLCLIVAMLIVGWRAFKRFGPPVASGPAIAFGKSQLVSNGAGLIMRAGRLRLLAEPYVDLSARRLADALGLVKPDPQAIDTALAVRLPEEPSYSQRAANLRAATKPSEILRAAKALKELEGKLGK
ncbi:MAG: DUF4350 domain-containing protein [Pseudomonadota bacterium]